MSVGRSVGLSVGLSHFAFFAFLGILRVKKFVFEHAPAQIITAPAQIITAHYCPCPPARDNGSRVYGFVSQTWGGLNVFQGIFMVAVILLGEKEIAFEVTRWLGVWQANRCKFLPNQKHDFSKLFYWLSRSVLSF